MCFCDCWNNNIELLLIQGLILIISPSVDRHVPNSMSVPGYIITDVPG